MSTVTFLAKCLAGDADLDDIGSFVEAWHSGAGPEMELDEYLGMTLDEYAVWVERPSALAAIVSAHRWEMPLLQALQDLAAIPMAARALDPTEANEDLEWLKKTERI